MVASCSRAGLTAEKSMADYLSDRTIEVTLDGTTKKISVGTLDASSATRLADQIKANLQTNLNCAFGSGAVGSAFALGGSAVGSVARHDFK